MRSPLRFAPLFLVFIGLLLSANHSLSTQAQEGAKQRPRRVGVDGSGPARTDEKSQTEEVDEGDVVRVETQLVSVPAVVTGSAGRPLAGLREANFLVYENGQPQKIATFATTDVPFEIALLLDTSGSTRADVALIRQAANAFVAALRPGDRVAIVAFNTARHEQSLTAKVDVLTTLTDDRKELSKAIENLGTSNGTPFYDALEKIAKVVFRDKPTEEMRGRRAVVALTDGVDSSSDSDFAAARASLLRATIASYFIQVNTEDFVEERLLKDCEDDGRLSLSAKQLQRYRLIFYPRARAEDYMDFCAMGPFERMTISRDLYNVARQEMNQLAKDSGGRNFIANSLQDARAAFDRVATEIGTQYSLGYYPTNKNRDGKFRAIRVELRGVSDKAQVRAREGYFAPKS
ncbi:MAG TPA: VWA domain-containing protein [Pyrinomonadaceae bacterium]|jgi:Ca-activated chloride channel family protein|nr:VWA domain-containing protein [Pyrinomonadaceae bacterium]